MPLTNAQRATLLTAIKLDPVAGPMRTAGDAFSLKAWCNAVRTPAVPAWRESVPAGDLRQALTVATYDSVTAGKRDAFRIVLDFAPIDATKAAERNGLADIFAVTGGYTDAQQAGKMLTACTESATNAQNAIGGTTPAAVAGVTALRRAFAGLIDDEDVNLLIAAP